MAGAEWHCATGRLVVPNVNTRLSGGNGSRLPSAVWLRAGLAPSPAAPSARRRRHHAMWSWRRSRVAAASAPCVQVQPLPSVRGAAQCRARRRRSTLERRFPPVHRHEISGELHDMGRFVEACSQPGRFSGAAAPVAAGRAVLRTAHSHPAPEPNRKRALSPLTSACLMRIMPCGSVTPRLC